MLLEFRVQNFRSFRDEVVLSLAANQSDRSLPAHTMRTGLEKLPYALRTVAIYGANASGKSNLLKAIQFMEEMVSASPNVQPNTENHLSPFRMRDNWIEHPSLFEATFIISGKRFQYGFELTRKRIVSEWLLVYESAKPQVWFSRDFDFESNKYEYHYSSYFSGPKKLWESATRKEVLFLSNAVQLNNEQLRPLYDQIVDNLVIFPLGANVGVEYTTKFMELQQSKEKLVALMSAVDTGISSISTEARPMKVLRFNLGNSSQDPPSDTERHIPIFGHEVDGKQYVFEIDEESKGTQLFFAISGPLLHVLEHGKTAIVDELDASLHPLLVQKIVELFNNPSVNKKGAQLIFSTHDVSLMDSRVIRRDQIWFTEKGDDQATVLVPLSDFSPRKGEALEKGYLSGRYGGVPILDSLI